MKLKKSAGRVNTRRIVTLENLQKEAARMKNGGNSPKVQNMSEDTIDSFKDLVAKYNESHTSRIQNEIKTLQSKIVAPEVAIGTKNKKYRGPKH